VIIIVNTLVHQNVGTAPFELTDGCFGHLAAAVRSEAWRKYWRHASSITRRQRSSWPYHICFAFRCRL